MDGARYREYTIDLEPDAKILVYTEAWRRPLTAARNCSAPTA